MPEISTNTKPTIFLAWAASDCKARREDLSLILQKAGLDVVPVTDCPSDDETFKSSISDALSSSLCSIHLLGAEIGRKLETDADTSLTKYQFNEVKKKITGDERKFKQFIWQCPIDYSKGVEPEQQQFINDIRNNITTDTIFTNVISPMQLVDDIRLSLVVREKPVYETSETEVFFISSQLDDDESNEVTDMLNDVVKLEKLTISQDRDVDYAELSVQQIRKSRLVVVYFKDASGWALPFAQQVWKKMGGASSNTPMLLIGDDEIESNQQKIFNAPKVVSKVVAKELIALEVKATFDKAVEGVI